MLFSQGTRSSPLQWHSLVGIFLHHTWATVVRTIHPTPTPMHNRLERPFEKFPWRTRGGVEGVNKNIIWVVWGNLRSWGRRWRAPLKQTESINLCIHLNKNKMGRNQLYWDFIIIPLRIEYYKSTDSLWREGGKHTLIICYYRHRRGGGNPITLRWNN